MAAAEVLERMAEDAALVSPWRIGETFADMLHTPPSPVVANSLCPGCRGEVLVDGEEPDPRHMRGFLICLRCRLTRRNPDAAFKRKCRKKPEEGCHGGRPG